MLLTWFGAVVLPAALAEFFFGNGVPHFWQRARWFVMPAIGVISGWTIPLGLVTDAPLVDFFLSTIAATVIALMVAVAGLFMLRFKRALTERELARTGRRSAIRAGAPLELRRARPVAAKARSAPMPWTPARRS